jgi:hypothetical protein
MILQRLQIFKLYRLLLQERQVLWLESTMLLLHWRLQWLEAKDLQNSMTLQRIEDCTRH